MCIRSEEHTSEIQSPCNLVCRLLLEKKKSSSTSSIWAAPCTEAFSAFQPSSRSVRHLSSACFIWSVPFTEAFFFFQSFFFFNDTATTEIYTLSLHDALPI